MEIVARMQEGTCNVACWHADMQPTELAQIGRMVQDRNVLSRHAINALAALETEAGLDPRFVHPDDARAQSQFDIEGVDVPGPVRAGTSTQDRRATVLVSTDAALKHMPDVRLMLMLQEYSLLFLFHLNFRASPKRHLAARLCCMSNLHVLSLMLRSKANGAPSRCILFVIKIPEREPRPSQMLNATSIMSSELQCFGQFLDLLYWVL
jgi:hypothetical protein